MRQKSNLSKLLAAVEEKGEVVLICRNGEARCGDESESNPPQTVLHQTPRLKSLSLRASTPPNPPRKKTGRRKTDDAFGYLRPVMAGGGYDSHLGRGAAELIRSTPEGLFVSAISAFEIGQKAAAGKLLLPRPVDAWFAAMLQWHGLHEIPVTGVIAACANLLPAIHQDPFDRLLIATAQEHRLATPHPRCHNREVSKLGCSLVKPHRAPKNPALPLHGTPGCHKNN